MASAPGVNPLARLLPEGQSVWLDYIRRDLMQSGELARLVREDGLRGMTSNPAIFEKAISSSADYAASLAALRAQGIREPLALYEGLAVEDIQAASDGMRAVYDDSKAYDGYVSLEVSPFLARDTQGTLQEARRLWARVNRPNVMIKVPATTEGLSAIRQLIAEGINVNVTLLFAVARYEAVAHAYLEGLEARAASGHPVDRIASVASFFVSRIDSMVDGKLTALAAAASDSATRAAIEALLGTVAIANAKLAYQRYQALFAGPRWGALAARGAQPQRLLWASTSTKNPKYRDVIYVEALIGPDTVNTIPPATYDAFRDHGVVATTLTSDVAGAAATMTAVERAGISMTDVTDALLDEGLRLFVEPFDKLLRALDPPRHDTSTADINTQILWLPSALEQRVAAARAEWKTTGRVWRLWSRDATIWSGADEANWLGWLHIVEELSAERPRYEALAREVEREGFSDIVLLGMGGSSLAPEVLAKTFGRQPHGPRLQILDSTDPAQVSALEASLDLSRTLFIVASKSGSTLEPSIFYQYFADRVAKVVGAAQAASRFVAITDPGSALERTAREAGFRHIFAGKASIGGRYSALSNFGMVPAAAMGLDVGRFLELTQQMVQACQPGTAVDDNPGVSLGLALGCAAKVGIDKVTVIASAGVDDLGAWLEQLVAESTGKNGVALIPVDGEQVAAPSAYGSDRFFVYLRFDGAPMAEQDAAVHALVQAGFPVACLSVRAPYTLGQEFFRWEIATAVAGAVMGINPFDQPDVEASKIATRALTSEYEARGSLPTESPMWTDGTLSLYTDDANAAVLAALKSDDSLSGYLRAHFSRIEARDYVALLAYLPMHEPVESVLQEMRHVVRARTHAATCLGFGPRFLHSTGQAYKGGPNTGVFLQITCADAQDLSVPGQRYSFGTVKSAQARGDFQVLAARDRRALRVDLGANVTKGLETLRQAVRVALGETRHAGVVA